MNLRIFAFVLTLGIACGCQSIDPAARHVDPTAGHVDLSGHWVAVYMGKRIDMFFSKDGHAVITVYGDPNTVAAKYTVLNGHKLCIEYDDRTEVQVRDYFFERDTLRIFDNGVTVTYQRQPEGT